MFSSVEQAIVKVCDMVAPLVNEHQDHMRNLDTDFKNIDDGREFGKVSHDPSPLASNKSPINSTISKYS